MIDLVLLIARLLFVALLYLFLFAIMRTGIGMVKGSRKKERSWTVSVERGPKELRGVSIAVHGPVIVGRSPGADIVIGAGYVSGRHARFQLMGQNLFVEDLGSKNGTAVNGRPVHDPVALRDKDLVTIGDVDIRVRNQQWAGRRGARKSKRRSAAAPMWAACATITKTPWWWLRRCTWYATAWAVTPPARWPPRSPWT